MTSQCPKRRVNRKGYLRRNRPDPLGSRLTLNPISRSVDVPGGVPRISAYPPARMDGYGAANGGSAQRTTRRSWPARQSLAYSNRSTCGKIGDGRRIEDTMQTGGTNDSWGRQGTDRGRRERQGWARDRSTEDRTPMWQELVGEHARIKNELWEMLSQGLGCERKGKEMKQNPPVEPTCDSALQSRPAGDCITVSHRDCLKKHHVLPRNLVDHPVPVPHLSRLFRNRRRREAHLGII